MKKLIILMLSILTLFSCIGVNAAENISIDTVKTSDWAKGNVYSAYEKGLIPADFGLKDYTVYISREKFCHLAATTLNKYGIALSKDKTHKFTDTTNEYVSALYNAKIITGKSDTVFDPTGLITREEAAAILYRMAEVMKLSIPNIDDISPGGLADNADISKWSYTAVYTMRNMAIILGVDNFNFSPKTNYTIEQAITTMIRIYEYK